MMISAVSRGRAGACVCISLRTLYTLSSIGSVCIICFTSIEYIETIEDTCRARSRAHYAPTREGVPGPDASEKKSDVEMEGQWTGNMSRASPL
jgi:hypothetical protein